MFQRRMLIVASRLHNVQLCAPKIFQQQQLRQQQEDATNTVVEASLAPRQQQRLAKTLSESDALAALCTKHKKSLQTQQLSLIAKIRKNFIYLAFLLYLLAGTLFYMFDPGNELPGVLAYFEAITIGFSVGLAPKDPNYLANPWFSTIYILFGAALIAVILTKAGNQVEESASMSMFESLQRRDNYEKLMSRDNPFKVRLYAFVGYHAAYLMCVFFWFFWVGIIMVWSMQEVPSWDFATALYFAVSLCSSAGSIPLPSGTSNRAYWLAGVSMMIGVPLMAMGVSCLVIMAWQGHRFKEVKSAAWDDVTTEELELLIQLGLVDIDQGEPLAKGGFILLGLLRMGQDVGVIKYLADSYDQIDERGGVIIRTKSAKDNDMSNYSSPAKAYIGASNDEKEKLTSDLNHGPSRSQVSAASSSLTASKLSTGSALKRESWSTSAVGNGSSRHLSDDVPSFGRDVCTSLYEIESGRTNYVSHLDPIGESHGSSEDHSFSPPERLESDIGDSWATNP